LEYVDVAVQAGVAVPEMDATGVCYGDINNDGYEDLYVLGRNEPNRLFINNGDGTFTEAPTGAGVGGGRYSHTSCSMGDIDGDGLLDIVVANTFDWVNQLPIIVEPFLLNQPNQLFLNNGDGTFTGRERFVGFSDLGWPPPGVATITWAIAMVDYDLDGNIDIIHAAIRGAFPRPGTAVIDRGLLHLLHDDGTGHFTDKRWQPAPKPVGAWMGLAFGDFNSDGSIDFMANQLRDYGLTTLPFRTNWATSRPGGFSGIRTAPLQIPAWAIFVLRPLAGEQWLWITKTTAPRISLSFGHIDVGLVIVTDNPGVLLRNDGACAFPVRPERFRLNQL